MKSANKGVVVIVCLVIVALAIFTIKKLVFDANDTNAARDAIEKAKQAPGADATNAKPLNAGDTPQTGLRMPGNKH